MLRKDPLLLKRRRIVYLFFLLLGALVVAWSVLVCITGHFRYGKQGPIITQETAPYFFWMVAIVSGLIGLIVVAVSLISFLRSVQWKTTA
jgi:TRAP-type C4-dicarboxylate transport system permease small subunit